MASTIHLAATFATELTTSPWLRQVVGLLGDVTKSDAGLVGVDIGHVDVPGHVVSEPCVGFVSRGAQIEAVCTSFRPEEGRKFECVRKIVSANIVPSRMTHWALCDKRPQINTVVFPAFTLVYGYDCDLTGPARVDSNRFRLIMHATAETYEPRTLSQSIQECLDAVSSAHDDLRELHLVAPGPQDLEVVLKKETLHS